MHSGSDSCHYATLVLLVCYSKLSVFGVGKVATFLTESL